MPDGKTTVIDTVEYKNVIPGMTYTLKGSLNVKVTVQDSNVTDGSEKFPGKEYSLNGTIHVKKADEDGTVTEEALEVDGKAVTAETTFTPETASGEVEVTFTFNAGAIANNADIEDGKQTTTVTRPQIGSTALDGHDGDKNVVTDG